MVLVVVLAAYTYFSNRGDVELSVKVNRYLAGALVLTSAASFAAVGLSLSTYALSHQFYTGGAYYVKVSPFPSTLNDQRHRLLCKDSTNVSYSVHLIL